MKPQQKHFLRKAKQLDAVRECGECTVCCEKKGVAELLKPAFVECQHVCATGCAIYGQHPQTCKEYKCLWRSGIVTLDELRPDKIGIMLDHFSSPVDQAVVFGIFEVSEGVLIASRDPFRLRPDASRLVLNALALAGIWKVDRVEVYPFDAPPANTSASRGLFRKVTPVVRTKALNTSLPWFLYFAPIEAGQNAGLRETPERADE